MNQSIVGFLFEKKDINLSDFRRRIDILVENQTGNHHSFLKHNNGFFELQT